MDTPLAVESGDSSALRLARLSCAAARAEHILLAERLAALEAPAQ